MKMKSNPVKIWTLTLLPRDSPLLYAHEKIKQILPPYLDHSEYIFFKVGTHMSIDTEIKGFTILYHTDELWDKDFHLIKFPFSHQAQVLIKPMLSYHNHTNYTLYGLIFKSRKVFSKILSLK